MLNIVSGTPTKTANGSQGTNVNTFGPLEFQHRSSPPHLSDSRRIQRNFERKSSCRNEFHLFQWAKKGSGCCSTANKRGEKYKMNKQFTILRILIRDRFASFNYFLLLYTAISLPLLRFLLWSPFALFGCLLYFIFYPIWLPHHLCKSGRLADNKFRVKTKMFDWTSTFFSCRGCCGHKQGTRQQGYNVQ